jgi:hypothetical protein
MFIVPKWPGRGRDAAPELIQPTTSPHETESDLPRKAALMVANLQATLVYVFSDSFFQCGSRSLRLAKKEKRSENILDNEAFHILHGVTPNCREAHRTFILIESDTYKSMHQVATILARCREAVHGCKMHYDGV